MRTRTFQGSDLILNLYPANGIWICVLLGGGTKFRRIIVLWLKKIFGRD